jgi:hypothetical protein
MSITRALNYSRHLILATPLILMSLVAVFYDPCLLGFDICLLDLRTIVIFQWPGYAIAVLLYILFRKRKTAKETLLSTFIAFNFAGFLLGLMLFVLYGVAEDSGLFPTLVDLFTTARSVTGI